MNFNRLEELSQWWGVSVHPLLYRLRELDMMSESTTRRAYITLASLPRRQQPIRDFDGEQPELLKNAIELLYTTGLTIVDIAKDLQLTPKRLRQLAGIEDLQPKLSLVKTSDDRRTTAATHDDVVSKTE